LECPNGEFAICTNIKRLPQPGSLLYFQAIAEEIRYLVITSAYGYIPKLKPYYLETVYTAESVFPFPGVKIPLPGFTFRIPNNANSLLLKALQLKIYHSAV
jgi:hypothetical protein